MLPDEISNLGRLAEALKRLAVEMEDMSYRIKWSKSPVMVSQENMDRWQREVISMVKFLRNTINIASGQIRK